MTLRIENVTKKYKEFTAVDNVSLTLDELFYLATLKGMKSKDIKKAIDYWLNRFDIVQNRDKKIEALSKGNQQKIQLLASMIHQPQLLILDEPFSGLDPVNVELLKSAVKELNDQGTLKNYVMMCVF